jgi:ubiquinone/menaquinone biosynthesis C-methylase UbiE
MAVQDSTQRFSSRVENYVRYRPGYPPEVLDLLRRECGLAPSSIVADIASGTGILTRIFLENGNRVFGVEPNEGMRKAGEQTLADYPSFTSVAGTAEATTLPDHSVDIVTAAQAAHWFDREKARSEFIRILRPGGWAVLVWNERRTDSSAFLRAYEAMLLAYGTDYADVRHERTTSAIAEFFSPASHRERVFEMIQEFDYPALEGRLLSSSYTPQPGHPNYAPMLKELRYMFDQHEVSGRVSFEYDTRVYYGRLK